MGTTVRIHSGDICDRNLK